MNFLESQKNKGLEYIMEESEVVKMPTPNKIAMEQRYERFCREYVLSGCSTNEAAKRLNIDCRTASRYLTKPEVVSRIKEIAGEIWRAEDERAAEQHKIAIEHDMADIGQRTRWLAAVVKGDINDMALIKGEAVEIPPKLIDRLRASEQLNKIQACYTQCIDLSGSMPIVIKDDVGADDG